LHTTSTDAETYIVCTPLPSTTDSSIRCNFEFDPNVTDAGDLHLEKQDLYTTSTDGGLSIVLKSQAVVGEADRAQVRHFPSHREEVDRLLSR
jgi:hypothetical protein